ncbi:MAG: ATP-dependent DNA helicase RecG [Oscillospiraceae bacterium]|nr:ATP-dependent DNA helicase RecG [Oscillospiraceae bacterium]
MSVDLNTDVRYIKGIGEKKAQALNKLGVFSLRDLVSFFPRKYEDRSETKPIALTCDGESVCVEAMVADTPRLTRVRRGLDLVKLRAVDDSGVLDITYFNMPYAKDNLRRGESYVFYGKIEANGPRRGMINPVAEKAEGERKVTGRIVPVYRAAQGLSQRVMQQAVRQGLDACLSELPDVLPHSVRERCELAQTAYAFENIHFPADFEALELARRRLIFEELFVLACSLGRMRGERSRESGIRMQKGDLERFWSALPFTPTGAQRRAVEEAINDMDSGAVMNRLVQGDVGSGKTLVAAALVWHCAENGYMSAFMAPTEILADQHYHTLTELLSPLGLRVGKLTGAMTAKEKRLVREQLKAGELDLVIGTHALFSADVEYEKLGLVVTDEQHRFGVGQRSALIGKGQKPHVLVMSATPIPRTLALIIYGDLDVSIIDELPPGRQKVDTFAVDESYRARLNGFIRKLVGEGRQVFVVCPMVEENDELPQKLKSAEEHAQELRKEFPDLRVACVHGKMKPKDKEAVMASMVAGETDILVATTVIEVGVDVPNAALIVVENAERFGLSQLHQLRGRVGRGQHKSWCILVSDNDGEENRARLNIMTKTNDGFKISEEDLRLRGPGDFFGSRQHGLPEMHVADLGADVNVLQKAQQEATLLLASDPALTAPEHAALRESVERLLKVNADSFN